MPGARTLRPRHPGVITIQPVAELTEHNWDFVLGVNAQGAFFCGRAALGPMHARKSGRIINVASVVGKEGFPNLVHHSTSKFAVIDSELD